MLRRLITGLVVVAVLGALVLAGMIAFGGPVTPPVNAGLAKRDTDIAARLADQPASETF